MQAFLIGNLFYNYLQGQRALLRALKSKKINAYPVFILIMQKEQYQSFMHGFGKYFQQVGIKKVMRNV